MISLRAIVIALGLLVLGAAGALAADTAANPIVLRFEGSNTVGQELAPSLVEAWARKLGLTAIHRVEGPKAEESEIVAEAAERPDQLRASIHAHGTGTGLAPLVAGDADIWMASRAANAKEIADAQQAGLGRMIEATNEHTIALDGLLIIVHRDNRINTLTIDQIGDIFSGKISRWSELGGRDTPINVYSRDDKSGTYDTFNSLLLRGRTLIGNARRFESSEDLSDEVASDPGGIGFIGFAYQRSAKALKIATGCGLVVAPSAFTVKTFEYPLARRLYMYTPDKIAANTAHFLDFAESLEAQDVVAKSDFIDFRIAVAEPRYTGERLEAAGNALDGNQTAIRDPDLQELEDATRGTVRLSVTFRFVAGSDRLDSQAMGDVGRLAEYMRSPAGANAKITLIGFTQTQGDYRLNRDISRRRAQAIRSALENKGVRVANTVGVGPAGPVACNNSLSRALNQRVEVWLQMSQAK